MFVRPKVSGLTVGLPKSKYKKFFKFLFHDIPCNITQQLIKTKRRTKY